MLQYKPGVGAQHVRDEARRIRHLPLPFPRTAFLTREIQRAARLPGNTPLLAKALNSLPQGPK